MGNGRHDRRKPSNDGFDFFRGMIGFVDGFVQALETAHAPVGARLPATSGVLATLFWAMTAGFAHIRFRVFSGI
jgi:hypothetical protein